MPEARDGGWDVRLKAEATRCPWRVMAGGTSA
jgi:hypothetical protein